MSKIFFCGDNHGNFRHIVQAVEEHRPDAIVLLGDIQAQRPLEVELGSIIGKTEIHFIHGNHDTDDKEDYTNLFASELAHLNLHGRVVEVAGVRIAGLGGIFRGKVWSPPTPPEHQSYSSFTKELGRRQAWQKLHPDHMGTQRRTHMSTIFPDVYNALSDLAADVLVTHEAPSCHRHGFEAIDLLAQAVGAKLAFHGHHHDRLDYSSKWEALGFRAYGVGFCGITDLDGNVIMPGDFDDEQLAREMNRLRSGAQRR